MNQIIVQPARELRVDFARWAVAQTPKVRTCSTTDFAVPPHLFTHLPEHLLVGSLVDGHRYVPVEDENPEWLTAVPGEPLPAVPDSAYGPDSVPLDAAPGHGAWLAGAAEPGQAAVEEAVTVVQAVEDVAAGGDSSGPTSPSGPPYACQLCPRTFSTSRGRDAHHRQVHREA
ncbi:hypothetical protein [Streptomyces hokutonensis]|uniref:hypothetical protein n=1 Tax=Streptomyces hokutonensis TaxID=1306990 RepID=UPI003682C474